MMKCKLFTSLLISLLLCGITNADYVGSELGLDIKKIEFRLTVDLWKSSLKIPGAISYDPSLILKGTTCKGKAASAKFTLDEDAENKEATVKLEGIVLACTGSYNHYKAACKYRKSEEGNYNLIVDNVDLVAKLLVDPAIGDNFPHFSVT